MADKLISADALRERMYHDAFETDSNMQKWDGGCWIRYKMFENALEDAPTVDAVPVVRCKDCMHRLGDMMCEYKFHLAVAQDDNDFCSWGERRKDNAK